MNDFNDVPDSPNSGVTPPVVLPDNDRVLPEVAKAFEDSPITIRVNFSSEGVGYSIEQVVFDPDATQAQIRTLVDKGILPASGVQPYVTTEVTKTTKGYTWSAKVANAPNVQSAVEMLYTAEKMLASMYGDPAPKQIEQE